MPRKIRSGEGEGEVEENQNNYFCIMAVL